MRCAIYRRVSTEMQREDGYSLDAQKDRLISYAESQGWTVVEDYADEGVSAKNIDRPALKRLLRDMAKGHFEVVLTYKLDRLVRSVGDLNELLTLFEKHNVKYKSATEMFDTTSAMGRFFIMIVGAMAQWERENLAERVKLGMTKRHEEGQRNGAVAPFGYKLIDGELIINEEEAKWVRFIFDAYKTKGRRAISVELNEKGVRTREGNLWNDFGIHYVITNPVYYGALRWNYRKLSGARTGEEIIVEGNHEAIITKEQFDEVQEVRTNRKGIGFRSDTHYPYTHVAKCARCGRPLYGSKTKKKEGYHRFYKCPGRFKFGVCNMPIIPESVIDEILLESLDKSLFTTDTVEHNDEMINRTELEKELEKLQTARDRIKKLFKWGDIDEREYNSDMDEIRTREIQIDKLLNEDEYSAPISDEEIEDIVSTFKNDWPKWSLETRKAAINSLISSMEINVTKEVVGGPGNKPEIAITDYQMR